MAIDEYLRLTGRKSGQFLFAGRSDGRGLPPGNMPGSCKSGWPSIGLDPAKFGTLSLRSHEGGSHLQTDGEPQGGPAFAWSCEIIIDTTARYAQVATNTAAAMPAEAARTAKAAYFRTSRTKRADPASFNRAFAFQQRASGGRITRGISYFRPSRAHNRSQPSFCSMASFRFFFQAGLASLPERF